MKILIHIGPHKTGTTAIQKCLFESGEQLARSAICYPEAGLAGYGHHVLANLLWRRAYRDAEQLFSEMLSCAQAQGARVMVISSEDFSNLKLTGIAELSRITRPLDVDVICAQRQPIRQIYSWWQEEVKHGSSETFSNYIVNRFINNKKKRFTRPDIFFSKWSRMFGRKSLNILKYRDGIDIVSEFLHFSLNIKDQEKYTISRDVNASFSPTEIEFIRMANRLGLSGLKILLDNEFSHLRPAIVNSSKRYIRKLDLQPSEELRHAIAKVSCDWSDRFVNLRAGERPIDDDDVSAREVDASFWLNNSPPIDAARMFLSDRARLRTL
jgi:hypothetical protein